MSNSLLCIFKQRIARQHLYGIKLSLYDAKVSCVSAIVIENTAKRLHSQIEGVDHLWLRVEEVSKWFVKNIVIVKISDEPPHR